jgi:hypothetical protein
MEQIVVEEEMEADRDKAVGGAVRADRLQEALSALAYVLNAVIVNNMNEECPALRLNVRSAEQQ